MAAETALVSVVLVEGRLRRQVAVETVLDELRLRSDVCSIVAKISVD